MRLNFYNTIINRTDGLALGSVVMSNTFNTHVVINDINIAFADGFGRAFRQASAASDAVRCNFHCHGYFLLDKFGKVEDSLRLLTKT